MKNSWMRNLNHANWCFAKPYPNVKSFVEEKRCSQQGWRNLHVLSSTKTCALCKCSLTAPPHPAAAVYTAPAREAVNGLNSLTFSVLYLANRVFVAYVWMLFCVSLVSLRLETY